MGLGPGEPGGRGPKNWCLAVPRPGAQMPPLLRIPTQIRPIWGNVHRWPPKSPQGGPNPSLDGRCTRGRRGSGHPRRPDLHPCHPGDGHAVDRSIACLACLGGWPPGGGSGVDGASSSREQGANKGTGAHQRRTKIHGPAGAKTFTKPTGSEHREGAYSHLLIGHRGSPFPLPIPCRMALGDPHRRGFGHGLVGLGGGLSRHGATAAVAGLTAQT